MSRKIIDPEAAVRIVRLEAQLEAALRQIEALRLARNAALAVAAWGGTRTRVIEESER
ncbi:hypothetical protein D3C83_284100 [compost metagenome]